jgi:putative ATP-dependent endonuclease of OLD family
MSAMFLSEIHIENFRLFGSGGDALTLTLGRGLTAIVGENDSGKTAVIDALRLVLGTRDQDVLRIVEEDFHQPSAGGVRANTIHIRCRFSDLSEQDASAFAEFLSFEREQGGVVKPILCLHWIAKETPSTEQYRRSVDIELRSGLAGDGPTLDARARECLCTTYLRPLRDAERYMTAGRRSRLSQILQHTPEVTEHGASFDAAHPMANPAELSVLGIGDFANALLRDHQAIKKARERLNSRYLAPLSFAGSALQGQISVNGARSKDDARLRQLLEKLELALGDDVEEGKPSNRGLGSNNLLFIACELLLLGSDGYGVPILLVEEPEAHLHPQRQLRLVEFLQGQATRRDEGMSPFQVILSTHSPYLASVIDLANIVVMHGKKAYSLAPEATALDKQDYKFLARFLDATKANMFFARGVIIVEGDAENLIIPTLARLIGRDLSAHGVSLVNVGGVGLGRYARIYQRHDLSAGAWDIPVACITDLDVMPSCAPGLLGLLGPDGTLPDKSGRRWRVIDDFTPTTLAARRNAIDERASGQHVQTFVSDHWTLEYDLAREGLEREVCVAARLAADDEAISPDSVTRAHALSAAQTWHDENVTAYADADERATRVYTLLRNGTSKTITAQFLATMLEEEVREGRLTAATLRTKLPPYLVSAIDYVTGGPEQVAPQVQ